MRTRRAALGGLALVLTAFVPGLSVAAQGEGQYMVNDAGTAARVRNILPAGEAGVVSLAEFLHNQADPTWYPPHINDQLPLYDGPTLTPAGALTDQQLQQFTKEATFGVADGKIESVETPKAGLTIIRDKDFGVPHIFATSRLLAEYGAGWVSAEDRLFMMDVLRHAGRGNLASLIGSSGYGNDCDTHYGSGYDQADADLQKSQLDPSVVSNGQAFADGVNGWIQSPGFVQHMPVEYNAFPLPVGLNKWTMEDIGAVGTLIGSQLGGGGGSEVANTLAYEKMAAIYGPTKARQIFDDLHAADDPESPTTIDQPFPYESRAQRDPASVALIDGPPSDPQGCVQTRTPPLPAAPQAALGQAAGAKVDPATLASIQRDGAQRALDIVRALNFQKHMSNAQVVNAADSVDGHPIADFGSQAAYWMPEIWMEMDVHAPDWDARGFQFPGTGVFVEIGRGRDFAWSATSAGSDNIDQRVERLCNPNPAPGDTPLTNVSPDSTSYWYKGRCLPMVEKSLQYGVPPSPGTLPSPPGQPPTDVWTGLETFKVERTVHDDGMAIVQGRTTVTINGQKVPVAVSTQRTNFMHELDQAVGFEKWNSNSAVHDARSFIQAAASVDTTFNWFYVDAHDTAYYSSGKLPIRNPAADPDLLNWATGEWDWQGILPASQHPHAINPSRGWMTSWNNRPAPHWGSSDSNWDYGSLYRNQMLDRELRNRLAAGGGKASPTDLFNVMQVASLTDFRAQRLLDEVFAIIGPLSASEQSTYGAALAAMASWHGAGRDLRQSPSAGAPYSHADGISYFDAFYPHVINGVFNPWFDTTGDQAYCNGTYTSPGDIPKTFDNPPNDAHCYSQRDWSGANVGSSYDGGWQDALDKDFRLVLGRPVAGDAPHVYCGGGHSGATPVEGTLATCRAVLLSALAKGISQRQTNYAKLTADDRMDYRSLGLFALPSEQWANKPTQQQFIEFLSDRSSPAAAPAPVVAAELPLTSGGGAGVRALALLAGLVLLGSTLIPGRQRGRSRPPSSGRRT